MLRSLFARTLRGDSADASHAVPGDTARIARGYCATCCLIFDKGMVSNQNERLSIPESRNKWRSAERLKTHALMRKFRRTEREFETGSATERVGSGMNGRRRSGARFQKRPLSAPPYRYMRGDLSARFVRHEQSRAVKAPDNRSDGNALGIIMPVLQLLFLEPLDLLVLALGDGGQRENLRPVDLMLVGDFAGAMSGGQFEHLVSDV
jgi:hypothetical protein